MISENIQRKPSIFCFVRADRLRKVEIGLHLNTHMTHGLNILICLLEIRDPMGPTRFPTGNFWDGSASHADGAPKPRSRHSVKVVQSQYLDSKAAPVFPTHEESKNHRKFSPDIKSVLSIVLDTYACQLSSKHQEEQNGGVGSATFPGILFAFMWGHLVGPKAWNTDWLTSFYTCFKPIWIWINGVHPTIKHRYWGYM